MESYIIDNAVQADVVSTDNTMAINTRTHQEIR